MRWSAWEVAGIIGGTAATTAGIWLSWNPNQDNDPRKRYFGRAAELLGVGLLLGISTERVLRSFIAERGDPRPSAMENPLRQYPGHDDRYWRLQHLDGRTVVEGYASTREAKATIKELVRRWGQSMRLVDERGQVVESLRVQSMVVQANPAHVEPLMHGWPSIDVRVRPGPGMWESSPSAFGIEAMMTDQEGQHRTVMLHGRLGRGYGRTGDPYGAITDEAEAIRVATIYAWRLAKQMPGNPHPVRVLDERGRVVRLVQPPPERGARARPVASATATRRAPIG